jgi:hypothetical protein
MGDGVVAFWTQTQECKHEIATAERYEREALVRVVRLVRVVCLFRARTCMYIYEY